MSPFLSNLALLVRCWFFALRRGFARTAPAQIKRICIVQVAQFGDMICTTPMFRAIKREYPDASMCVVGTALNKEVVAGNPDLDEYIVWSHDVEAMTGEFKKRSFDFACTTSPNFPGLAALYLAGVPSIAAPKVMGGWSPTETLSYKLLRLLVRAVPHNFYGYAPREYLRLLEPIGIHTDDTKKFVYFEDAAKASVAQKLGDLAGKPYAVVSPSAGNKIKRWPPERFAEVAEYVAQKYVPVVVIGAAPDRREVSEMMAEITNAKIINLAEKLSVGELKALIAGASLFISVDTGPLYIAEALGVPTIDIVGPVSEHTQPPHGPRNIVLAPSRKRAEIFIMNTRVFDQTEAKRQATNTTVAEVTGAVDSMLCRS